MALQLDLDRDRYVSTGEVDRRGGVSAGQPAEVCSARGQVCGDH